jgi:2-polyprenyl-3-methyl-5-hydroxy-6-metoxy-1,4-benzoquinol methylase
MYEKFGKSFEDILALKHSLFEDNQNLLTRALAFSDIYTAQPQRLTCKLCDSLLPTIPDFVKHRVPYVECKKCEQLNGLHQDSDDFCKLLYTQNEGKQYATNYDSADASAYSHRTEKIYIPKAKFLLETLSNQAIQHPETLSFGDMGAGAGYFVSAMRSLGVEKIEGYEVGKAQVDLANWMLKDQTVKLVGLDEITELAACSDYDVITFIGVFEHLQQPRAVLRAVASNRNIKYIYICVPLFSPTIFGEMVFPDVMPRQLTGGHTHLFSDTSLNYMANEFGLERIGAWWFGTDIMDLYRSFIVSLSADQKMSGMHKQYEQLMHDLVDDMQLVIDKKRKSSQVHMVFKVH